MHWTSKFASYTISLSLGAAALAALSQTPQTPPPAAQALSQSAQQEWWRHAVLYEIYPRSFQDSDGDGIGDIKGITARLDYLHDLGIDAIWITPMYPSPGVDYGYDISDYTAIDPVYGSMADFDNLVAEAKKRDIRVIMDYVINHTSDQHAWFLESRSSRDNPKRDWYIWRDGKGETATDKGLPPSNWQSWFGHSAWQWDDKTRQYYYHYFYVQQPDLNWRNPEVHTAMDGVLDFSTPSRVSSRTRTFMTIRICPVAMSTVTATFSTSTQTICPRCTTCSKKSAASSISTPATRCWLLKRTSQMSKRSPKCMATTTKSSCRWTSKSPT
jgi:alpha-glucosidase